MSVLTAMIKAQYSWCFLFIYTACQTLILKNFELFLFLHIISALLATLLCVHVSID